jgi:phospholipid/cholesterol/gamma-HCH transport system substrate-binding protein
MLEEDRPVVRSALNNVNDTTAKLGPLIDNFQKVSVQANSALAHLDAAIGEDRPDIRQSVASLRQALGSAAQLTDQLNASVNTNSENLDEIIDNLRHVTENLNSLTETLKTRPYTLIRPSGIKPRNPGDKPPQ